MIKQLFLIVKNGDFLEKTETFKSPRLFRKVMERF